MKTKEKRGVTLITLTVTIVLLLILAGVSTSLTIGNNGLFEKAKSTQEIQTVAGIKEALELEKVDIQVENKPVNLENYLTQISNGNKNFDLSSKEKIDDKNAEIIINDKYKFLIKDKENGDVDITYEGIDISKGLKLSSYEETYMYPQSGTFTVTENVTGGKLSVSSDSPEVATASINGNTVTVQSGSTAGTAVITVTSAANANYNATIATCNVTVVNIESLKIGDYVNYTYDRADDYILESKYSGYTDNNNQSIVQTTGLNWKILNIDKTTGMIDILSENPTDTEVIFQGILGYHNGPYLMNEICKAQYSNQSLGTYARNINLLDMEKNLTSDGIRARNASNLYEIQYGTTKRYTGSASYYPKLYKNQKGAGINTTSVAKPDLSKGNDPYDESKKIATTEPTTDGSYGMASSSGLTVTHTLYDITINSQNYGEAASVLSNGNEYWIASRCIYAYTKNAYFGLRRASTKMNVLGLYYSTNPTISIALGDRLRPIVSLKSDDFTGTKDSSGTKWLLK